MAAATIESFPNDRCKEEDVAIAKQVEDKNGRTTIQGTGGDFYEERFIESARASTARYVAIMRRYAGAVR